MFKKLRIKYIATIMCLLIFIVTILFVAIYYSTKQNNENTLFSQMDIIIDDVKRPNNANINEWNNLDGILILVNNNDNSIQYKNGYNLSYEEISGLVEEVLKTNYKDKGFIKYGETKYAYILKRDPKGMSLLFRDSQWYDEANNRLIITFIIIGLASLILLYFISTFIAKSAIKPVEAAYNDQKRFIADASHELKTPLAIIKTNLDVLNDNKFDTIDNQKKWFNYISFQTERMSKLVNDLLYLAKADNKESLGTIREYNFSDAIMNQVLSFEGIMFEKNIMLKCNIEENILLKGDKEAINQVVGILVDNAIKHAFSKSEIVVSLMKDKQKVVLSVQNIGDTIKAEDLEKIFERFYRVDKSRSRETGSYGLGLSIAKSIVEKHKGIIRAESKDNITAFIVEF